MECERAKEHYKRAYASLLKLYPWTYRERFGKCMEQTFSDILRDQRDVNRLLPLVLWIYAETTLGIMKEIIRFIYMQPLSKSIMRVARATACILLVPLLLQLTIGTGVDGTGFNWEVGDFVVMGALVFVAGLIIETVRTIRKPQIRMLALGGVVLLFVLIWAHLAVGIVDSWPLAGS